MKRTLTVGVFLVSSFFAAYSDYVYWTTIGGRYCTVDETISSSVGIRNATMGSLDVLLEYYEFHDESSFGPFYHNAFMFPSSGSLAMAGMTANSQIPAYAFLLGAEIAFGPACRFQLARGTNLIIGIGPTATKMTGWTSEGADQQLVVGYALGMVGVVGLKLDFADIFFVKFGVSSSYLWVNRSAASTKSSVVSEWANSYSTFSLSPYIGLGVNNHVEQVKTKSKFSWL